MYTPNDRVGTLGQNRVSKLYQKQTFAELLTEYASRTGPGDAERAAADLEEAQRHES